MMRACVAGAMPRSWSPAANADSVSRSASRRVMFSALSHDRSLPTSSRYASTVLSDCPRSSERCVVKSRSRRLMSVILRAIVSAV